MSQLIFNNSATAPDTPASGKVKVYTKTDKSIYIKDDTGAETKINNLPDKVSIDAGATADFIGATATAGVIRVDDTINYADGGDFITMSLPQGIDTTDTPTFAGASIASDTDTTIELGRAKIGSPLTDTMYIGHFDRMSNVDAALKQTQDGTTTLNSRAAKDINFTIGSVSKMVIGSSGLIQIQPNTDNTVEVSQIEIASPVSGEFNITNYARKASNTTDYALRQQADGTSYFNSRSSKVLHFCTGGNDRMLIDAAANLSMGSSARATPLGQLDVWQSQASKPNEPVLYLQQADVSEQMAHFECTIGVGNAIEAVGAKLLTTTHFIKVTITGGLTRYFPVGTIA